jgi:hypothetical protein
MNISGESPRIVRRGVFKYKDTIKNPCAEIDENGNKIPSFPMDIYYGNEDDVPINLEEDAQKFKEKYVNK